MSHNIVIQVTAERVKIVYHPKDRQCLDEALGTNFDSDQRAGYVYPEAPFKRAAFKVLRKLFGGTGRVSDWTRTWRGPWMVTDAQDGRLVSYGHATHEQACNAEIEWVLGWDEDE